MFTIITSLVFAKIVEKTSQLSFRELRTFTNDRIDVEARNLLSLDYGARDYEVKFRYERSINPCCNHRYTISPRTWVQKPSSSADVLYNLEATAKIKCGFMKLSKIVQLQPPNSKSIEQCGKSKRVQTNLSVSPKGFSNCPGGRQ